jgi:DNA-binding NarL/FixJ family response regulator
MIRVLLAQQLRLVREGLRRVVERQPEMTVVGECADASEIPAAVRRCTPDVILVDTDDLPARYVDAIDEVTQLSPGLGVVVVGDQLEEAPGGRELLDCSWAIVDRQADIERVLVAIRDAATCAERLARRGRLPRRKHRNGLRVEGKNSFHFDRLTARERQMFGLLAQGYTLRRAAELLQVSYKTGDTHKVSLMRKLDVHNRVELARLAIRERIVSA